MHLQLKKVLFATSVFKPPSRKEKALLYETLKIKNKNEERFSNNTSNSICRSGNTKIFTYKSTN